MVKKTVQKWPKSQLFDVKMTSKSLFLKKKIAKNLEKIFLWDRLYDFFALLNLPALKLQNC